MVKEKENVIAENFECVISEIRDEAELNNGAIKDAFVEALVPYYDGVSKESVLAEIKNIGLTVERCSFSERNDIFREQAALHGSEEYKGMESTYMNEISMYPLLTREEEHDLALAKENKEAFDKLVRSNLRLVVSVAKKFVGHGVPLMDLIQEGNIGLMKAIERFDPCAETKLSTYAVWWIKQSICRYIANCSDLIRKPVQVRDKIIRLKKVEQKLTLDLGREPTKEELIKALHITTETYEMIRFCKLEPASIDKQVNEDGDFSLADCISDGKETPEEQTEHKMLRKDLEWIMGCLEEREKEVVCMRNGFYDDEPKTLAEIGKRYGLSRERVRQIENKAYKKLRSKKRSDKIKGYMEL